MAQPSHAEQDIHTIVRRFKDQVALGESCSFSTFTRCWTSLHFSFVFQNGVIGCNEAHVQRLLAAALDCLEVPLPKQAASLEAPPQADGQLRPSLDAIAALRHSQDQQTNDSRAAQTDEACLEGSDVLADMVEHDVAQSVPEPPPEALNLAGRVAAIFLLYALFYAQPNSEAALQQAARRQAAERLIADAQKQQMQGLPPPPQQQQQAVRAHDQATAAEQADVSTAQLPLISAGDSQTERTTEREAQDLAATADNKMRDGRVRIYTPVSLLRSLLTCLTDACKPDGLVPAATAAELRACTARMLQDDAFVIGGVRRPCPWTQPLQQSRRPVQMVPQLGLSAPSEAQRRAIDHVEAGPHLPAMRGGMSLLLESYAKRHEAVLALLPESAPAEGIIKPDMSFQLMDAVANVRARVDATQADVKASRAEQSRKRKLHKAEQQALPPELRNKVGRPKRARLATATSAAEGVASEAGAAGDGGVQALLGGTGSGALLVQRRKLAEEHRRRTLKKQYLKWQRQLLKHGAADDNSDVPLENLKLPARFKGQSLSRQSADARSEPSESSDDDMDLSDHELSGWQGLQPGEGDESENDLLDEPGSDGDPELY